MTRRDWLQFMAGAGSAVMVAACAPLAVPATQSPPTESVSVVEPTQEATEPATPEPSGAATEMPLAATGAALPAGVAETGQDVIVSSGGKDYKTYLAAPDSGGPYPAVVLIHSFNGLEPGYRTMTDRFAAQGFVVATIDWQTFERQPPDAVVMQLTQDAIAYLTARPDVDKGRLGLTGFCAGGRYTMLFLPQIKEFKAGVAWYGFPYSGDTQPASLIPQLTAPMLIIHGSADQASPVSDIYKYADALKTAGKDYELKVYDGEPHGFMVQNGQLRADAVGVDALMRMVDYFKQKLG